MPGRYRWVARGLETPRLAVGGSAVASGTVFDLSIGTHQFRLLDDTSSGLLVLALNEDPQPAGPAFYDPQVIREIDPLYPRF